ncbi:hypothetical protein PAHAL_2G456400 [Panicum hallii]|uniref:Uncharacterized protein n=1 Tax=Panicum hallii TaxID=206008 RepID=A0A2T8KT13_9POAL|nr:hypothetical protein PAHAL_2G456400 [Panicum hallii]
MLPRTWFPSPWPNAIRPCRVPLPLMLSSTFDPGILQCPRAPGPGPALGFNASSTGSSNLMCVCPPVSTPPVTGKIAETERFGLG